MQPGRTAREVADGCLNLLHLSAARRCNPHPCPNRISIAFDPNQIDRKEVPIRSAGVPEDGRKVGVVGHQDV